MRHAMNKYRFVASNLPDTYGVFDRATMTRVPGWVSRNPETGIVRYWWAIGAKELKTIETQSVADETQSVAEMSAALEKYLQGKYLQGDES